MSGGRPASVDDAAARLREDPAATALLFDFDGTLSPIVEDPATARPAEGAVELLDLLAHTYRTVAVISGRPVAFLEQHLPASLHLSGLYGLESVVGGERVDRPGVEPWRAVVADAAAQAEASGIDGLWVEPKGLSVTFHYRRRPAAAAEVEALTRSLAASTGLDPRPAKMSFELHPPVEADKGLVVRELAAGAAAVLYLGDDVGDLPAIHAVHALEAEAAATGDGAPHPVTGLAAVVDGPELPAEVRAAADLLVDGQPGMLDLLRALAGRPPG